MKLKKKLASPWRITFDTNPELCNLRCIMCDTHSIYNKNHGYNSEKIMDISLIKNVISSTVNGLKEVIPSTMGEPLLYKNFIDLINIVQKYNIKLNLTTNGTFPIYGVEKWAEMLLPVLSDIKISINGVSGNVNQSIMIGINHERLLKNIEKFALLRDKFFKRTGKYSTITLQVTFMEKNLNELPPLLKYAIAHKIDRIKGHHLWITWPEIAEQSLKRNNESISRWNKMVDSLLEIKALLKSNIKLDNFYKLSEDEKPIPNDWICPFLGREAWISWDGKFNVCCAPDFLRKELGYFGNVYENDFMELWNSKEYTSLIKTWENKKVCKNCNMRRPADEII